MSECGCGCGTKENLNISADGKQFASSNCYATYLRTALQEAGRKKK